MLPEIDFKTILVGIVIILVLVLGADKVAGLKDQAMNYIGGVQQQVQQAQQIVKDSPLSQMQSEPDQTNPQGQDSGNR